MIDNAIATFWKTYVRTLYRKPVFGPLEERNNSTEIRFENIITNDQYCC